MHNNQGLSHHYVTNVSRRVCTVLKTSGWLVLLVLHVGKADVVVLRMGACRAWAPRPQLLNPC